MYICQPRATEIWVRMKGDSKNAVAKGTCVASLPGGRLLDKKKSSGVPWPPKPKKTVAMFVHNELKQMTWAEAMDKEQVDKVHNFDEGKKSKKLTWEPDQGQSQALWDIHSTQKKLFEPIFVPCPAISLQPSFKTLFRIPVSLEPGP